jgi:3-hydroxybutyryl-CoA dehydrogenase
MKILARGEKIRTEELKQKLSSVEHELTVIDDTDLISVNLSFYDLIIDLTFDEHPEQIKFYAGLSIPVIVSAVKTQLARVAHTYGNAIKCTLIGINALPTFINRPLAEVSLLHHKDIAALDVLMGELKWEYKLVEDRVGMVTPRVVFMIINEACYTVQEGTASIKDIDTSMKLGTNYPYGPFEWADKIGVQHVYETLKAVYEDTKEERYKICPLLQTIFLKSESFSSY